MYDKKVKTTIKALKYYINTQKQELKTLDQDFVQAKRKWEEDRTVMETEIQTAIDSISTLEKQLSQEEIPELIVLDETKCPACKKHNTQRRKVVKERGKNVQQWECLGCGMFFNTSITSEGVSADVGTRPGAGPTGPTGTQKRERYGVLDRARKFLDQELTKGRCILFQQIQEEADVSQSAAWRAACEFVEEDNSKYEFYKDPTTKFHLKGVRPIDSKKRRLFCPGCKTLLIPGKTCKKCTEVN